MTEMPSDSFLQGIRVPSKYINILQDLCSDTTRTSCAEGGLQDPHQESLKAASPVQICSMLQLISSRMEQWKDVQIMKCIRTTRYKIWTVPSMLFLRLCGGPPRGLAISWTKTQCLPDFEVDVDVCYLIYLGSKISIDCTLALELNCWL